MNDARPQQPDCYWVEPGKLLAGEYPGHEADTVARRKVQALIAAGVRVFVDLTDEDDDLRPYEPLVEAARAHTPELSYHRLSIRDVSVPTAARMREILSLIDDSLAAKRPVYVHCWGGTGRTGTVVGCWLVEQGRAGDDPIDAIRSLRRDCGKRHRLSPDTEEQCDFVRRWSPRGEPAARQ